MMYKVTLESTSNPGKFTFITVEGAEDLEDCVNHIRTKFSSEFTIDQITEINE